MLSKISEFEAKFGIRTQAFGYTDDTHIPLKAHKGYFMDVDCRWPGSCHDAKVYVNSSINRKMQHKDVSSIYKQINPGEAKTTNYLIGNTAYPLTSFCMKERESCKSNAQTVFNSMLRKEQNPIECAYGLLKARCGILNKKIDFKLESIPTVILTCFALHNFCERNKKGVDEDIFEISKILKKISLTKNILEKPQTESMSEIC